MDSARLQRSRQLRLRAFLAAVLLAGAGLGWSLFGIQVVRHEGFEARAQSQQERRIEIGASRGTIYDRNGVPLAVNRERYSLYLIPRHVKDPGAFVRAFTEIVPHPPDDLRARLGRGGFYVPLRRTVDRATARRLQEARIPGVGVETTRVRHYPHGRLASAVIGQVDLDNHGIGGLELQYDDLLRGESGWAVHQRDAEGREYPNFALPVAQPVDGHDVMLTLDVGLQEIAEEALQEAMASTLSRTGSLVVADPRTGEVLAMANRPDADPNTVRRPARNHAAVDVFEPGSTFKLVTLAGLYEQGLARPEEEIFCENGTYNFSGRRKPIRDVHPYGLLTVEDVIGKSSNICTIKLAQRLGDERMFDYARRFGFGVPTGIDFPGEARGVLRLPREWSGLSAYSIAMGYEVSVTAVQLTMMFAAIANGGDLLQPYLVRRITAPEGREVLRREGPRRIRRVISGPTAELVSRALVRVVQDGTGTSADLGLLQVAGKSGTAYKIREGGKGYAADRYTSTFGGFFPAHDPRLVVFVRLDDPRGEYYGGLVAGPVFKKAVETTLFTKRVPVDSSFLARIRDPQRVVQLASTASDGGLEVAYGPPPGRPEVVHAPLPPGSLRVPDFTDMSLREALIVASQRHLELRFSGPGAVLRQQPAPGAVVGPGTVVQVVNAVAP
ncbi:MAG: transpeptidase family protein [Gemmatimonadetes bacterium]|nr:transpeptidase family protein [Gemmatimonadota bacterium]